MAELTTLSGGEQKRLALECLLRGPDQVPLLDEPDNYLDVPGKRWLEAQLRATQKTVLLVSHDRELLAEAGTQIAAVELGGAGNTVWVHGGGFATFAEARRERFARLEERRRRWDEEHHKLRELMLMYKRKAAYNDGMASRYQAAQTRLARFEDAGPPQAIPLEQKVSMRLTGGRTGKRAIMVENLELTGLMKPFDAEIWFGDQLIVWRCRRSRRVGNRSVGRSGRRRRFVLSRRWWSHRGRWRPGLGRGRAPQRVLVRGRRGGRRHQ